MGVIIRQSFKSTLVLYIGVIIGVINRLFLLPHFLTLEQLGLIDLLFALAMILGKISTLGIIGAITKFFTYFKLKNQLNYFSGFFILIPFISFLFFGLIFYLFKDNIVELFPKNIELLNRYYPYIIVIGCFIIFKEIFTAYSLNKLRLTVPNILNDTFFRFSTLTLLVLIGYNLINFDTYILFYTITNGLIALFLFIYLKKYLDLKINFKINNLAKNDIKKVSIYSLFMLLSAIASIVSQYTDSIMLASIKGLEVSAIYSVAFFIGVSIEMPKRAITSITGAVIAEHWNNKDINKINHLYRVSSINQGILGIILFYLVFINLDEIFYILPKSEILSQGKSVAIIIGLSKIIDMITGVNAEILRTSNYYKIDLIIIACFIWVSIVSNQILIPILGLEGAAYSTLISVFLYNLARYVILKKLFQFDPFNKNTVKLFLLFFVIVGLYLIIPKFEINSIISAIILIAIKTLILGGIFIYLIYKLKISIEVNKIIQSLLIRVFKSK